MSVNVKQVVDLQSYPSAAFNFSLAIGLYIIRYRRKRLNLPQPAFKAWDAVVIFNIFVNLYLLIMPWYPPATGRFGGDVSFWYATYIVVGIAILLVCGLYYIAWMYVLPQLGKYRVRQEVLALENKEQAHRLVKVPVDELEQWDATHDALGREIGLEARSGSEEKVEVQPDKA